MGYTQAYNAYKETNVKTASQGRLVVLLYEEAVRQLTLASSLFSEDSNLPVQNIERFGKSILKSQEIITELQVSLDMEKGGEIARNLMSLYVYFNKELLNASISHDKKKLLFIKDMLSQLHSSWVTAASSQANTQVQSESRPALNIQG